LSDPKTDSKVGPDTEKVRINYSVGYQAGGDLKRKGIDIDQEILLRGVEDAVFGREALMTRQEMREVLTDLQKRVVRDQEQRVRKEAAKNLAAGKVFLTENRKQEGVVTLPSGLQYRIIKEGVGKRPKQDDTVTVHYRGTLIDGTEVDRSDISGKPPTFRADRVIPGWKEALMMMNEGAKWQLFIPPDLAYGQRRNGRIGPNSTLIFELELLSVKGNTSNGE
jgi:FKBP-type peptidyl-prolyl cis-trans isomerase FklB